MKMVRLARALLPVAALLLAVAVADAAPGGRPVPGFKYLYSTNLHAKMESDVLDTVDASTWEGAQGARTAHKCAKACVRQGAGSVCKAWTMCWKEGKCYLLSRLPDSLDAGEPAAMRNAVSRAMGTANTYSAKCTSGLSEVAINTARLDDKCNANLRQNTMLTDTMGVMVFNRNRVLSATFDANQPSAADCCALCAKMKRSGCNSWTYSPHGSLLPFPNPLYKCTLRTGENPVMTVMPGTTSGLMT